MLRRLRRRYSTIARRETNLYYYAFDDDNDTQDGVLYLDPRLSKKWAFETARTWAMRSAVMSELGTLLRHSYKNFLWTCDTFDPKAHVSETSSSFL